MEKFNNLKSYLETLKSYLEMLKGYLSSLKRHDAIYMNLKTLLSEANTCVSKLEAEVNKGYDNFNDKLAIVYAEKLEDLFKSFKMLYDAAN